MRLIKTHGYRFVRKCLGERFAKNVAIKWFGYRPTIDIDKSDEAHRLRYPSAKIVSGPQFMRTIFKFYYDPQLDPNAILPGSDIARVCSYVPYYRGCTDLVIYNFLRQNYGIRDPVLVRASVFSQHTVIWSRQMIVPGNDVVILKDPAETGSEEIPAHGTLVIEVFHPDLPAKLNQFRFFGIYRDERHGIISGVHSLHIPKVKLVYGNQPFLRSFAPKDASLYYNSSVDEHVPLESERSLSTDGLVRFVVPSGRSVSGFYTVSEPVGAPGAMWHDGPVPYFVEPARVPRSTGTCRQGFTVPDFQENAPSVLASRAQIGFRPKEITFTAFDEQGHLLAKRSAPIVADDQTIDLLLLFDEDRLSGLVNIIADFNTDAGLFEHPPVGFLHLYYRSRGGYGDQVHSEGSRGYWIDPLRTPKSYRCRKFAPLLKDDTLNFIYSIVNVGTLGPNPDDTVKVRLFSDRGGEFVFPYKILSDGVSIIRGETLLELAGSSIDRGAIVQIEHETTNYSAFWFAVDKRTKHIGVDHFTGG